MRYGVLMGLLIAHSPALLAAFERPIPAPHTATAEAWFAFASVAFCVALYVVYWMVNRRR